MSAKEVAIRVAAAAKEVHVRFPKIWDDAKIMVMCGTTLMLHRSGASFDETAALETLIETYGIDEAAEAAAEAVAEKTEGGAEGEGKKRKSKAKEEGEDAEEGDGKKAKKEKPKLSETFGCDENSDAYVAMREIGNIYFKNGEKNKASVFSKAAKAIRESETCITDLKTAMSIKGVGKGIAGMIMELREKGSIRKLEELRAGTA
mmetsp:Transcript_33336/g.73450  ORF Transcript_33336/g.73450 Transcript_33336/m.73450 type:complete len:204 (-) Transcript_33336:284-895(-)|eukprot:CAMPEP_0173200284 /NCGR_PEP_ID=MMETSP1141-20130122/17707_1 /TAXON_ID=483371 /ORGANISM="non described non described, Strain CCMP2298" /LENGTH=203 /DNA_ID=CAMNT_0014125271 /DNA_START=180 /DNA_END=791 /DNA_ORIENTATION=-